MKPTLQSKLKLRPIAMKEEKKNYIVEDIECCEFYEMNSVCIEAIRAMGKGYDLGRIEVQLKQQFRDEVIDILAFVEELMALNLIEELDGQMIHRSTQTCTPNHSQWISLQFAKFLFQPVSIIVYFIICAANIGLFISYPNLIPHYKDIFIFDSMIFNSLTWMLVSTMLLMNHEMGHVIAIRAQGLSSKVGINYRLVLIVLETEMKDVWRLPPRLRNIPYLAGLCFDNVLLFTALILQMIYPQVAFLNIVVFYLFVMIIYQFLFFMKTDLYYVLENLTGCYNLMENSKAWLDKFIPFNSNRKNSDVFAGEERMIKSYGIFYLSGVIVFAFILSFYILPQMFYALRIIFSNIMEPAHHLYFLDAVFFVLQLLLVIGLLFYSRLKSTRASRQ